MFNVDMGQNTIVFYRRDETRCNNLKNEIKCKARKASNRAVAHQIIWEAIHMAYERYQVISRVPATSDKEVYTIFIRDLTALAEIPEAIANRIASGSVAYTMAPIEIYHRDEGAWKDKAGTVVG